VGLMALIPTTKHHLIKSSLIRCNEKRVIFYEFCCLTYYVIGNSRLKNSRCQYDTLMTTCTHIQSSLDFTEKIPQTVPLSLIHHHLVHPLVYKSIYTEVHVSSFLSSKYKDKKFGARQKSALPFSLFPNSSIKA
jgi:hypothetical protein